MPHTFAIRFARNSGLAALFEAPANSFHWKGSGRLSIDDQWLVFARSRSFPWPLARRVRRVPAAALVGVYREGDSLRLEFGGSPRLVVPIWARDHAEAAEIVRQIPTDRSVEVDGVVESRSRPASRHRVGIVMVALVSLTLGVVATSIVKNHDIARDSFATSAESTQAAKPASASPPSITLIVPAMTPTRVVSASDLESARTLPILRTSSAHLANPDPAYESSAYEPDGTQVAQSAGSAAIEPSASIAPGEPGSVSAQPRSDFFRVEAAALQSEYISGRTLPDDLESGWWALSVRLYNSPEFDDWRLRPLVDAQLGVSLNWRASLSNYADAQASGNRARIAAARADLEDANELTDRVLSFSY